MRDYRHVFGGCKSGWTRARTRARTRSPVSWRMSDGYKHPIDIQGILVKYADCVGVLRAFVAKFLDGAAVVKLVVAAGSRFK